MKGELQDSKDLYAFFKAYAQELYNENADRQNLPALYNSIGLVIP